MVELDDALADIDTDGFCVIPNVLESGTVSAIRDRLLEQAAAERVHKLDFEYPAEADGDDINQWVYQLLNKGHVFRQLPTHPVASALATHVLGAEHLLSAIDCHITHPGNKQMPLHADQWWMPQPVTPGEAHIRQGDIVRGGGPFGSPEPATTPIIGPLVLNIMWMITDFTVENGATRLVPRSHLSGCNPRAGEDYNTVVAEGSAGSIVAWDGRTWHAAGLNVTDGPRVGLTTYFSGPMIRSLANSTLGTRSDVRADLPEELLNLMGFRPFSTYGMTDDPNATLARAGDETVGEMAL